ncbi:MAG TPA: PAS domain S-box protein [Chitinophagaceae bacterium]
MEILSTEQFVHLAVASADAGTFYIELDTDSIFYSPSLSRILTGTEQTGLSRSVLLDYLHPDDFSIRNQAYEEAGKSGHLDFEVRFIWQNGSIHWVRVLGRYIYNDEGKATGFSGIVLDTTEKRTLRNEQQKLLTRVETSERRFRSMIEQAPVAMGILRGKEFVIDVANDALLELWGKTPEIIGKALLDALPEIRDQVFIELLNNVLATGDPYYGYEFLANLRRNGKMEECYFNFVYAPYYEAGIRTGIQIAANEVTAQVVAKKQLEESEKRFRNLVEEAPMATAIYSGPDMIVSLANEAMLNVWGKDASIIGKPLHEGIPELEGQPYLQLLQNVFTTGEAYSANESRADLVVDGRLQTFYFNFTYKPLRDTSGNVYAILNMAADVTESVLARQKVEEQEERYRKLATELDMRVQERTRDLQRANESLERSNTELAQYAYVASHDLQEPLRKIRVFSSMLKERAQLNKEASGLLSRVISSSDRMSQLINDLLEFSRLLNAGKAMRSTDLNETLQNVLHDFELFISEKSASVEVGKLPVIEAVPLQMNQLFTNLLSNALKFSKSGEPLHVMVNSRKITEEEIARYSLHEGEPYYEITFSDNGIGFDPRFAEQIFEVFKRLHNRQAYPGSGIGLALCRKIVENHNGHLFATSEEGKGTSFHIILPKGQKVY